MCGIAGIVNSQSKNTQLLIKKMITTLMHRGPDGVGFISLPGCVFGHARLSIIDLQSGNQPMVDSTGRFWITFNGEIYNYPELKHQFEKEGFIFKTKSDTEVIIASYAKWKSRCVDFLRGMFAFAIWDSKEKTLFCARDLFGEKPLYYHQTDAGEFIFASDIRAILAYEKVEPELDLNSVDAYLSLMYVPPSRTIYKNIQTLPPGHTLELRNGRIRKNRYWLPAISPNSISLGDAAEQLDFLMNQSVKRQMIADVPVGAFLSGGLDSSTIVALMQAHSEFPIKTFSAGFGGLINELPYAKSVANRYNTEHYELDLELPPIDELFMKISSVYDEPFADSSSIPTYLIAQFASNYVKVVLSGDGGDELFGGYGWYPPLLQSPASTITNGRSNQLDQVISKCLINSISRCLGKSAIRGKEKMDEWQLHISQSRMVTEDIRQKLWGSRYSGIDFYKPENIFLPPDKVSGIDRAFFYDLSCYLPGDILVKSDRAAMANSLETRAPFLDRDLAEFALTIPWRLKLNQEQSKIVMRSAFKKYWPKEIHNRNKQGFGAPFSHWLNQPGMQHLCNKIFSKSGKLAYLMPGLISNLPLSPDSYNTWILLTLGAWLEQNEVEIP